MLSGKICHSEKFAMQRNSIKCCLTRFVIQKSVHWKEHSTSSIAAKMSSFVYCLYLAKRTTVFWDQDCKCKPLPFDFPIGPDGLDHAGRRGGVVVEVVHVVVHVQRRHRHGALRQTLANWEERNERTLPGPRCSGHLHQWQGGRDPEHSNFQFMILPPLILLPLSVSLSLLKPLASLSSLSALSIIITSQVTASSRLSPPPWVPLDIPLKRCQKHLPLSSPLPLASLSSLSSLI